MAKRGAKAGKPRVLVGIPNTGTVKTQTALSVANMCWQNPELISDILQVQSCYVHVSRERMLEYAIQGDHTHLLFVDSDMTFQGDALPRLLAAKKDVIGAAYNMRVPRADGARVTNVKFLPEVYEQLEKLDDHHAHLPEFPKEPFEVRGVPTGLMLIRCEAAAGIPHPRFFFEGSPFDSTHVGEDIFFCDRAREHGLEVWCDPTLQVGHIGDFTY